MNSNFPADLLELKDRFETWRTSRKYVREPIVPLPINWPLFCSINWPHSFKNARKQVACCATGIIPLKNKVAESVNLNHIMAARTVLLLSQYFVSLRWRGVR